MNPIRIAAAVLVIALVSGCATMDENFVRGRELIESGKRDEGLALVARAVQDSPRNAQYRAYWYNQRSSVAAQRSAQADAAARRGDFASAEGLYKSALAADPSSARAAAGLARLGAERANSALLAEARKSFAAGDLGAAEASVRKALANDPSSTAAREMLGRVFEAQSEAKGAPAAYSGPLARKVTLEFRDTTLRAVFESVARATGVNFIFDKDVRADSRVTFFVRDTPLGDLLRMVLLTQQLEHRVLNDNTLLIYPNSPQKQKEYQELAVRSFYLGNADAKQTLNMIRTVLKTRDLFVDDKLNLLIMRDTPQAIRVAEKLVAAQDVPDPEVLLELEVLEVKRGKLQQLGIQWPNTFTALNIVPAPSTTTATGGVVITTTNPTTTTTQLTVDTLRSLTSAQVGVSPNPELDLRNENSDVTLLANPRIRVRNHERAKIHIGDRVPVITTTSTANVGVSESVSYLDVGLKLDVQPTVYLDNEVGIKMDLEVSSITREVQTAQGALTYQLGTRNASTSLRVKDGETQILAGLISDEERRNASKVPILGDIPLLGHLFGTRGEDNTKTEIVLLVTPHVVRNITPPPGYVAQLDAGTEAAVGVRGFGLASASRAGLGLASAGPTSLPAPRAAAAAPAPAPLSARLDWQGPDSAAPGGSLQLSLSLAEGPPDAQGSVEFVYDPAVFAAEGAAPPGRVSVPFSSGAASLQLRVLPGAGGKASSVSVGGISLDAGGLRIASPPPVPRKIEITAGP